MWPANAFGRICLCLSDALSFESIDVESLFLICSYEIIISRSSSNIKVIGLRSRSHGQKACLCTCSRVVLPSIER